MSLQIITDTKGRKIAAVLPWKEYKKMLEQFEELEDVILYDAAKKKKCNPIPVKAAFKMLDAKRKRK